MERLREEGIDGEIKRGSDEEREEGIKMPHFSQFRVYYWTKEYCL